MAEEKARILNVLEALSECADPARTTEIGASIGETPLNVGHDLYELGRRGLAEKPNKKESLWLITDKGRETIENPPTNWIENLTGENSGGNLLGKPPGETSGGYSEGTPSGTPPVAPSVALSGAPSGAPSETPSEPPEEITVPSQAEVKLSKQ